MSFSGEWSTKRKVSLAGRSKEDDRKKLLEKARLDRERRQRERLEKKSATSIQVCLFRSCRMAFRNARFSKLRLIVRTLQAFFRGRMDVRRARGQLQEAWASRYGVHGEQATM